MAARVKKEPAAQISRRELHAITRALSDPRRFEILKHIASGSCAACVDLRAAFPVSAATLSHHLRELESAGLIEIVRRGKFVDAVFRRSVWEAYLAELLTFSASAQTPPGGAGRR